MRKNLMKRNYSCIKKHVFNTFRSMIFIHIYKNAYDKYFQVLVFIYLSVNNLREYITIQK